MTWWSEAVLYQVYVRSFQDSDGDGEGDLAGVTRRLPHIAALGADALWLSPFYVSPMADGGYDIADHTAVDPRLGTLDDLDELVAAAHRRGIRVVLDLVPNHTSIAHPWFVAHPERYVWSPRDGPANNWVAAFGGPAWSRDAVSGRWYLHSFYPDQPDLDWRNPDVPAAIAQVIGVLAGARGRRLSHRRGRPGHEGPALGDDPPALAAPRLREPGDGAALAHVHSRDAPDIGVAPAAMRTAAPGARATRWRNRARA